MLPFSLYSWETQRLSNFPDYKQIGDEAQFSSITQSCLTLCDPISDESRENQEIIHVWPK